MVSDGMKTKFNSPSSIFIAAVLCLSLPQPQPARAGHVHNPPGGTDANTTCTNAPVTNWTQFLDPLPRPPKAVPARTNFNYCVPVATNLCYASIPEYDMPMTEFLHSFHTNLPPVPVWGYAGSYPGPTFDVDVDSPILVNWINRLPATYPSWLSIDTNFHGVPDQTVRTVTHLHGAASLPRYDGHPANWFRTGESDQYFYGNINFDHNGQTLWYHDHTLGVTAANVYAGLAGFYLLRNRALEASLNLPSGDYEIPLVFQDRDIQTNCPPASLMSANIPPWHTLPVVNGKVTPYLEVEPRRYRFRVLNGAGFRTFGLSLVITDSQGIPLKNAPPAPPLSVIGTEDGFLPKVVNVPATNMVPIMSGERVDMIIDFTSHAGRFITMTNLIDKGNTPFPPIVSNLMQFRVTLPLKSPDTSSVPGVLVAETHSTSNLVRQAVLNRDIALDMTDETPFPGPPFTLGKNYPFALINLKYFHDPVTELPHAGDTEIWSIINLSDEAHPFHIHLTDFRVIDRVRFAGWNTNSDLAFPPTMVTNYINDRNSNSLKPLSYYLSTNTNDLFIARAFEAGPKDTMRVAPFAVTRLVVTWPTNSLYYTTPSAVSLDPRTLGGYVYHCHILDHEDNDMMRPFQLLSPYRPRLRTIVDPAINVTGNNHFKIEIPTRMNETYGLESTTGLSPAAWLALPLDAIVGSGAPAQIIPPPATDPVRFYRVKRLSPP